VSTLAVLRDLILSGAVVASVFLASGVALAGWRHMVGRAHPIDPATLPARGRHPSRALPRRWE